MYRIKNIFIYSALLLMALSITTPAYAFDNQLKVGVGSFTIQDSEPGATVSFNPTGMYAGWVGVFTPNLAIEARLGGTEKKSNALLSLQATFFQCCLNPHFRSATHSNSTGL